MTLYANDVFAPIDRDHFLERIAGGNETEVFCTDDRRYVVKLKSDLGGTTPQTLAWARKMRDAAEEFAQCLGPEHSIPSHYIIARDSEGQTQVLVVQPFVEQARPLSEVDYDALSSSERSLLADQLRDIIRRALLFYRVTGSMPDLYGRSSKSTEERAFLNAPHRLPWRMWSFLIERHLLHSYNLLLTSDPVRRIIFIDYDIVRQNWLYRTIYYFVRWMLFWRDHMVILLMKRGGNRSRAFSDLISSWFRGEGSDEERGR